MCVSLMISDVEHLFHVPVGHLYVLFVKMSIQVLCPFLNRILFVAIELYEFFIILDINPLTDI